jgi:hypothetical protein
MNSPAEPTEAERTALEKHTARKGQRSPCPNLKFARHGPEVSIVMNHLDQETGFALVMQALGSTDPEFRVGAHHPAGQCQRPQGQDERGGAQLYVGGNQVNLSSG